MENNGLLAGARRIMGLEDQLSRLLEPVTPDPVFVDALKLKLARTPAVILESGKKKLNWLILVGGVTAGALIVWLFSQRRK